MKNLLDKVGTIMASTLLIIYPASISPDDIDKMDPEIASKRQESYRLYEKDFYRNFRNCLEQNRGIASSKRSYTDKITEFTTAQIMYNENNSIKIRNVRRKNSKRGQNNYFTTQMIEFVDKNEIGPSSGDTITTYYEGSWEESVLNRKNPAIMVAANVLYKKLAKKALEGGCIPENQRPHNERSTGSR